MNRNIVIAGGTGLLGRYLVQRFLSQKDHVTILTRQKQLKSDRPNLHYLHWHPPQPGPWTKHLAHNDIIINLAGESVFTAWTAAGKKRILDSRLHALQALIQARRQSPPLVPQLFIHAGAIGYYGNQNHRLLTEQSPAGETFLAHVCQQTEEHAHALAAEDHRLIILRVGVVLARDGGFLPHVIRGLRFIAALPPVRPAQYLSWIHIEDAVRAIMHLIDENLSGVFNLTAPQPVQTKSFYQILARKMGRPLALEAPNQLTRWILGRFAEEVLLASQNALPQQLLRSEFNFRFTTSIAAIENLLSKDPNAI